MGKEFIMVDSDSDDSSQMMRSGDGREYFLINTWYVSGYYSVRAPL